MRTYPIQPVSHRAETQNPLPGAWRPAMRTYSI